MHLAEKLGKLLGLLICVFSILFFPIPSMIQWSLFLAILITVGIPHGGIDHLIHNPKIDKKGIINFIIKYMMYIFIYLIIWYFIPSIALLLFIIMSAYHFGQSHFIQRKIPKFLTAITLSSKGAFFLLVILFGNWEETKNILKPILNLDIPVTYQIGILITVIMISIGLQVVQKIKITLQDWFDYLVLGTLLYFSPLFIGFIVYFGFWHALPSMAEEYRFLKHYPEFGSFKKFILQLIPFSVISLIGIGLILFLSFRYLNESEIYLLFFALVSLISFPHILYMDKFLKKNYQY
jgi:Brp/Blh family beta-carotene 15,15'-monooxygenase